MLTILAWLIFVPALVWNIVFFSVVIQDILSHSYNKKNIREDVTWTAITVVALFVPGVYLFGWF